MSALTRTSLRSSLAGAALVAALAPTPCPAHGTVVFPISRVYRIYLANPDAPAFPLAASAVALDGTLSYYTWNEVSRNIPEALAAGLPAGFDYSPWMPDGELASAGRTDPTSSEYPRTYAGLDQVSSDWPTTPLVGGSVITVDFYATAAHDPSVWDVWMTTPGWDPSTPLTWNQMELLGRPTPLLSASHYTFPLTVPTNRSGHHVLWVAWQRNDPAGEVFVSASDVLISNPFGLTLTSTGVGDLAIELTGIPSGATQGYTIFSLATSAPVGSGSFFGLAPDTLTGLTLAAMGSPFHVVAPFGPDGYPAEAFAYPPGALSALTGLTLDGVVGMLDASYGFAGVTNVSRVTL